jgi:hypothetical protein
MAMRGKHSRSSATLLGEVHGGPRLIQMSLMSEKEGMCWTVLTTLDEVLMKNSVTTYDHLENASKEFLSSGWNVSESRGTMSENESCLNVEEVDR